MHYYSHGVGGIAMSKYHADLRKSRARARYRPSLSGCIFVVTDYINFLFSFDCVGHANLPYLFHCIQEQVGILFELM